MSHNKTEVYYRCIAEVDDLIRKYQEKLDNIKESMEANDVQTDYDQEGSQGELLSDFERYATHLDHARNMKEKLSQVDKDKYSEQIRFGSLIETQQAYFFIVAPIGRVSMDDGSVVQVISTEAPIYEKLEGKRKGDTFPLNDEEVEILDVH